MLVPRRRRKTLLVAIVILISITAGAGVGAFLGVRHEDTRWTPLYQQAVADATRLRFDSQTWRQSSQQYSAQLQDLQTKIAASVGDLNHPRFVLWDSCGGAPSAGCPLLPTQWYAEGVPDTFTFYVSFRSTVPVDVAILSIKNYTCWQAGTCAWHPVAGWTSLTKLSEGVFHGAEGCGGYLVMFFSRRAGTFYPKRVRSPQSRGAFDRGLPLTS